MIFYKKDPFHGFGWGEIIFHPACTRLEHKQLLVRNRGVEKITWWWCSPGMICFGPDDFLHHKPNINQGNVQYLKRDLQQKNLKHTPLGGSSQLGFFPLTKWDDPPSRYPKKQVVEGLGYVPKWNMPPNVSPRHLGICSDMFARGKYIICVFVSHSFFVNPKRPRHAWVKMW